MWNLSLCRSNMQPHTTNLIRSNCCRTFSPLHLMRKWETPALSSRYTPIKHVMKIWFRDTPLISSFPRQPQCLILIGCPEWSTRSIRLQIWSFPGRRSLGASPWDRSSWNILYSCRRLPFIFTTMVEQFVGTWTLTASENFDEYMKALGKLLDLNNIMLMADRRL